MNNPQAFPNSFFVDPNGIGFKGGKGMTLRDYWQGQIMMGFASKMNDHLISRISNQKRGGADYIEASKILANTMLKERDKGYPNA